MKKKVKAKLPPIDSMSDLNLNKVINLIYFIINISINTLIYHKYIYLWHIIHHKYILESILT